MTRQYTPKAGFWIRLCVVLIYPFVGLLFRHPVPQSRPDAGPGERRRHHRRQPRVADRHAGDGARCVWQSGRVPRFMIKAGLFEWPVVGWIVRGAGQIPVSRGTTEAAKSLHAAVDALERGEAVVIYPEGTTTKDPQQLADAREDRHRPAGAPVATNPVIPIGQWGAQQRRRVALSRRFRTAGRGGLAR